MPRTRRAGRKGGAGMLSNLMGKTQKTKDKEQRINQAWEQSGKDQKVWEERRVVIEKAALEAKAKAESDAKEKAALEAKEKAVLDARIKAEINTRSEIESLWKWNTDLARKLGRRRGRKPDALPAAMGPDLADSLASADKKLTIIQANKAALIKSLEGNNTTTSPRGGRTKKRRFRHPKKGRKSRTHKRR